MCHKAVGEGRNHPVCISVVTCCHRDEKNAAQSSCATKQQEKDGIVLYTSQCPYTKRQEGRNFCTKLGCYQRAGNGNTPVAADASTHISTPELPQPQEGREYCVKFVCLIAGATWATRNRRHDISVAVAYLARTSDSSQTTGVWWCKWRSKHIKG